MRGKVSIFLRDMSGLSSPTAHLRGRAPLHHSLFDSLQPGDERANSPHLIQLSSHLRPGAPQLQSLSHFIKSRCVCLSAPVSVSDSLRDKPRPPHNSKHTHTHTLPDLSLRSRFHQLHPPDWPPAELLAGVCEGVNNEGVRSQHTDGGEEQMCCVCAP